jgi:hypothetical protein
MASLCANDPIMKCAVFFVAGCMLMQLFAFSEDPVSHFSPATGRAEYYAQIVKDVRNNRVYAPEIATNALNTYRDQSILCAGKVICLAIHGLGKSISKLEIARLIKAAVETRPDALLEIVRVAIEKTRPQLHPDIVAAAAAAVHDPYMQVSIRHMKDERCFSTESSEVSTEDRDALLDCERGGVQEEEFLGYDASNSPGSSSLAEAIVTAAIGAGSTASLDALFSGINYVLFNPAKFPDTDVIPLPTPSPVSP